MLTKITRRAHHAAQPGLPGAVRCRYAGRLPKRGFGRSRRTCTQADDEPPSEAAVRKSDVLVDRNLEPPAENVQSRIELFDVTPMQRVQQTAHCLLVQPQPASQFDL